MATESQTRLRPVVTVEPSPAAPSNDECHLLYAFVGQSNMVGQGTAGRVAASDRVPDDSLLDVGSGSLIPAFVDRMAALTGVRVAAVKAARNGAGWVYDAAGTGTWAPTGPLMAEAARWIDHAVDTSGIDLAGIVALGGESDAIAASSGAFDAGAFERGFRETIRGFRARLHAPIYFILPGHIGFAGDSTDREAAVELVRSTMSTVVAEPEFAAFTHVLDVDLRPLRDEPGRFVHDDGLHFNQHGLDLIGRTAADGVTALRPGCRSEITTIRTER